MILMKRVAKKLLRWHYANDKRKRLAYVVRSKRTCGWRRSKTSVVANEKRRRRKKNVRCYNDDEIGKNKSYKNDERWKHVVVPRRRKSWRRWPSSSSSSVMRSLLRVLHRQLSVSPRPATTGSNAANRTDCNDNAKKTKLMPVNVNEPVSELRNKTHVVNNDSAKKPKKMPANGNGKKNDGWHVSENGTNVFDGKKPNGGRRNKLLPSENGNVKTSGVDDRKSARTKTPPPPPPLLRLHVNEKSRRDVNANNAKQKKRKQQHPQRMLRQHKRKHVARPKNDNGRRRRHEQRKRLKPLKPSDNKRRNNNNKRKKKHNGDNKNKPKPKNVHVKRKKPKKKPNDVKRKMKSLRLDDESWNVANKKQPPMAPVLVVVRNSFVAVGAGRSMINRPRWRRLHRRYNRRLPQRPPPPPPRDGQSSTSRR